MDSLFGVELRQVKPKDPLWAEDVQMFNVAVDGKEVGRIFLDLQARSDKQLGNFCTVLKGRVSLLTCNPFASQRSLLTQELRNNQHMRSMS